MDLSRRDLMAKVAGALSVVSGVGAAAALCGPTAQQQPGPYPPPKNDLNRDNDLVQHKRGAPPAKGERVLVTGQVMDTDCKPISGARVEIWQACATGRYNHAADRNRLALDPNFQYWGHMVTDATGKYTFRTIIPGYYPLDPRFVGIAPTDAGQYRPPHIHFRVHAPRFLSITTQMYFDPKSYDLAATAKTVADLNRWEGVDPSLTVLFSETGGIKTGSFDLVMQRN